MQNQDEKGIDNDTGPITEESFRQVYQYQPAKKRTCREAVCSHVHCQICDFIRKLFPILQWIPAYKWKEDLVHDVISGATVAVIHIPQGLAYGLLGGVPPIVGIYMAFFPVLIYIFMGTSKHISLGAFAVLCMMVSSTVTQYSTPIDEDTPAPYTPVQVAMAVTLMVGIWQVLLGVLKMGFIGVLFSETLVSGFTTGVAIHVFTSQVKSLLGAEMKRFNGPLKIIYSYYDLFGNIKTCNWVTVVMSACCITLLLGFNEGIKPLIKKGFPRCFVPVPIELFAIILGTVLSVTLHLNENYNVIVVGYVPTGLPSPALPPVELLKDIILDGFIYAIVATAMNLSLGKMFARIFNYEIDVNQELLAYGCGNLFASFFSCMPFAASMSRSVIQQTSGCRTQMTSIVSCSLLFMVILFMGPLFESLPHCVLASIVVVALKGMLFQVKDFFHIYKISKLDALVWIMTFLSVVIIDLDIGLAVGLVMTILTMLIRSQSPQVINLGQVPDTDIYLDTVRFKSAKQLPNVLILQIVGGLNFANCDRIRVKILKMFRSFTNSPTNVSYSQGEKPKEVISVVLDLVCVPFVDPSVCKSFIVVYNDLGRENVPLYLCQCNVSVYNYLLKCKFFESFPKEHVFPTIHDTVEYIESKIIN